MTEPAQPFRLYPRRAEPTLDPDLFQRPTSEYRGTPFWCWNDRLDRAQLLRQLDVIQRMGFGGFHIHSRTGLATEYLGKTWMDLVRMCVDEARRRRMRCWLYDEDRWPSGYAGGLVTREMEFRQRHLLWTRIPYGQGAPRGRSDYTTAIRNETGRLVARYEVALDATSRLARYRRLSPDEAADGPAWYAYIEPATSSTWFNGQTAVDVFSVRAIEKFIETTHERYRREIRGDGALFGTVIPAFFTDEPQFVKKSMFARGDEAHDLFMPISEDFLDSFAAEFEQDLLDHLPELFWNLPDDAPSLARYRYHEHTAARFAGAFSDTLGEWCGRNGVALTGHMLGESSLMSQTRGCGEAMRGLRSFQIPGIDMLCDKRELTTALQARSIAHQFGREGVASELYGVTGWHFDFVGHKAQGDWQAALGVTVRVPHLFWMSMRGEAKRDYPASIGEQSPWFEEYGLIEDHFARLATVMTRGTPATRIAVIHPIESAWLHWGPVQQNADAVRHLEETFAQLPEWLLFGQADFDYLSESLLLSDRLPGAAAPGAREAPTFDVGAMRYDCVLVPPTYTLRSATVDALEHFAEAGGTVLFAGAVATCVDARASDRVAALAGRCRRIPFEKTAILESLRPWLDVAVECADGSDSILHRLRIDGAHRHLFLVNTCRTDARRVRLRVPGAWTVTRMDTMTGHRETMRCERDGTTTVLDHAFPPHGHLLLSLAPGSETGIGHPAERRLERSISADPVPITLTEANVLLLDRPRFRLGADEPWSEPTEILRADNQVRARIGLPPRTGRGVQPWADPDPAPALAVVELLYTWESEVDLPSTHLAMESPEAATIWLDGRLVSHAPLGWWVDESIQRVALPPLGAGEHEIRLAIPFTRRTELEAIYLLGDFGVRVEGARARIQPSARSLRWGDWTSQGLPFYGGNVVYHLALEPADGAIGAALRFPRFANPLLSIASNGQVIGKVAFAPYEVALAPYEVAPGGAIRVEITAFGNRANTFGPLHNADPNLKWIGPGAWRTVDEKWQEGYALKPMGILEAPRLVEAPR